MDATVQYRASRNQLLTLRGEHDRAVAEFSWPELEEKSHRAVDRFDAIASGLSFAGDHP